MSIQEKKSSKGTPFAIVKFSDLKSEFELFLFSDLLTSNRENLKGANSFVLTLQKDNSNNPAFSRRINIKKLTNLGDFTKQEYEKVTIEVDNKSDLNELQNILKENGSTKIEIKIKNTSKIYTFSLKNLRKFNIGIFNHIKNKEYVKKISF
jgi:DNA polymerase-3 subunit alpha